MIDLDELERNNLCLLHCKNDPIVPYNYGACFSIERLPHVYGSNLIVKRMNNLGFHNYNFFSFDIIAHAYYYDIVYGIGIDHQKFEDCFRISYDFIERHIYKPDSD